MANIAVYEVSQYNAPVITWRASVTAGQVDRPNFSIRFVGQDGLAANHLRQPKDLPCNYMTLTDAQLLSDLEACQYNTLQCSILGAAILEQLGLSAGTPFRA